MNEEEINDLIEKEGKVVFFKKKSEESLLKYFLSNMLIINFFYYLFVEERFDYLVITNKRCVIVNKNKLIKNILFISKKDIDFNAVVPEIKVLGKGNVFYRRDLSFLRLTYEELQEVKKGLN